MQPDEIKSYGCVAKWLTEGEASDYQWTIHIMDEYIGPRKVRLTELEAERLSIARRMSRYFERLAESRERSERRRVLMKKHEFIPDMGTRFEYFCPECEAEQSEGHKPDCAWDAALKGAGGGT